MSAVDFGAWVTPPLELHLPLGGTEHVYTVQPPSVEAAKQVIAAAVRGEIVLGMVKGEVPDEVQAVLDSIAPGQHPALGAAYAQMAADGQPQQTIDRTAYYAVFYWARGKEYADALARGMWARDTATPEEAEAPAPKG